MMGDNNLSFSHWKKKQNIIHNAQLSSYSYNEHSTLNLFETGGQLLIFFYST